MGVLCARELVTLEALFYILIEAHAACNKLTPKGFLSIDNPQCVSMKGRQTDGCWMVEAFYKKTVKKKVVGSYFEK